MQYKYRQKTKIKHAELPDLEQPAKGTKVICPSCSTEVPVADINIVDMVGKCHSCNSIFSFAPIVQQLLSTSDDLITNEIGRPEGIELNYFQDELEITAQQGTPVMDIILASLSPLTALIGVGIYADGSSVGLALSVISLFFLIWSIISLIRMKHNKIYISIDDTKLEVAYRPRNFVTDKSFLTSEIEQVFVKADATQGGFAVYTVLNGSQGQKQSKLMGGIKSELKAKFIEQEIEHHLGIPNKKVIGELQ